MASNSRVTLPVKGLTWKRSALLRVGEKSGRLSLSFNNITDPNGSGGVNPGNRVAIRCYEAASGGLAVGAGTAVIAEFQVAPGGQVVKDVLLTNDKRFLVVETKGVDADHKGAVLNLDVMSNGLPFHGQVDIDISGGKSGMGFFGYTGEGVSDGSFDAWPEEPSEAS